ncbi:MAG TPA: DUF6801 domain-containing protein [Streptosporangiaceae bacterium]|jgi:hypothetical protein|nr:DUF6801 domain-containing protein [Streptosporangiaceae bacterium]
MSARYGAGTPRTRIVLGVATALGAASGIVGVLGAGTAAAQPASSTLRYTCSFPTIGGRPITARISMDIPTSLAVGESSRPFAIKAVATVDATFASGLRNILGVRIIEGTLDAETSVTAPQGEIGVPVHLTITKTSIASGSFDIPATGTAPTLTFSKPGSARITAGDFTLHLVPKDANGNITYPGKINVPCTLNTGQDNVVTSFDITGARTTTGPAASGTTGPPTSDSSGTATALPSTTATPGPTGSTINASATSTNTTGGKGTGSLILLAAGVLAAAVAAAAFRFGPRLKSRRRPGEDG